MNDIEYDQRRSTQPRHNIGEAHFWPGGPPFFWTPRGVLVHRVRTVFTLETNYYYFHPKGWRNVVRFLCGNVSEFDEGDHLVYEPPPTRIVCEACERVAREEQKPTADQLVGRHVHVGRVRAMRTCCPHLGDS